MDLLLIVSGHAESKIWHASWSSCGKYLATCSDDKTVKVFRFDVSNLVQLSVLEGAHSRTIRSCEFSPDGELLATASFDGTVIIWEASTRNKTSWDQIASLEGHENEVKMVAWNNKGNILATCGRDKRVWLWERLHEAEFECISVLEGHTQDVKFVKWDMKENILYSAGYDDTIRVWSEHNDDWYCQSTISGHKSTVWGICPDITGKFLCSCSADCSVIIWAKHILGDEHIYEKCVLLDKLHEYSILSIDWNRHLPYIITASEDNTMILLEILTAVSIQPRQICQIQAHDTGVNCVRWNPTQSDVLVSVGDDGYIKIWRLVQ